MENSNALSASNLFAKTIPSLDKIAEFLMNPDDPQFALSDKLIEEYERLEMASDLIKRYGDGRVTHKLLLARINLRRAEKGEDPIHKQTVYRIIADAMILFGSARTFNKAFWQQMLINKEFERYLKCDRAGNDKGADGAMKNLIKLGGFDKPEETKWDPHLLQPNNFYILLPNTNQQINLADVHNIPDEQKDSILFALQEKQSDIILNQIYTDDLPEAESEESTTE